MDMDIYYAETIVGSSVSTMSGVEEPICGAEASPEMMESDDETISEDETISYPIEGADVESTRLRRTIDSILKVSRWLDSQSRYEKMQEECSDISDDLTSSDEDSNDESDSNPLFMEVSDASLEMPTIDINKKKALAHIYGRRLGMTSQCQ